MQVKDLKYMGTILRVINDNGVLWFRIKDIATILGAGNARQLVDIYCNKEEERKFPALDSGGRHVNMVHINLSNVMEILTRSNYKARNSFLEWLKLESVRIAPMEPLALAGEPRALEYGDKSIRTTNAEGDLWFMLTDVTLLLGYTNPRYLLAGIGDKLVKRLLPCKAKGGAAKNLIHVNTQCFQALIEKSKYPTKPELLGWLDDQVRHITTTSQPQTEVPRMASPVSPARLQEEEPISHISKIRKRKPAIKILAITKSDYIALSGKSKSTVYDWVNKGVLPVKKVGKLDYLWITDRDEEYDRIVKCLETRGNETGIVAESLCTFLGRKVEL